MEEVGQTRSLVDRIREQQTASIGHIMRRQGLDQDTTTRKLETRQGKGRQRLRANLIMDSLAASMNIKEAVIQQPRIEEFGKA